MYTYLLKMQAAFWGGEEVADPRVCSSSRSKEHRALSTVARHILFSLIYELIPPTTDLLLGIIQSILFIVTQSQIIEIQGSYQQS